MDERRNTSSEKRRSSKSSHEEGKQRIDPAANKSPTATESSTGAGGEKNSEEIERDIGHTRQSMGRTVDEIERRMRPEYLGRQAQEAIRTSASQASNRMLETLSENPVPSLIAGLSIGWLIANGRRSNGHPPGDRAAHFDNPTEAGHRERTAQKDTNGSDQSSISDQAREKAEEAGKTAQHYGEEAWHSAEETTRGAKRQARRGIGQAERMIKENPLGAGIVSLAVGAFAGLMVPGTRREDELMGETRDEVVDKAKETARETTDRAKDVAKKTAEEAQETAKKETRRQKAKSQGSGSE